MSNIKVFSQGSPPDSMWLEPVGTWTDIITGRRSAEGLFVRAEDCLTFAMECIKHVAEPATKVWHTEAQGEWCGSEGGTPRKMIYDDE